MKKYSRLIVLVLLIIGSVGMFYIVSAIATKQLPQLEIHKTSGDEKEIEPLVIKGTFGANFISDERFNLDAEKTTYARNSFFLNRSTNFYEHSEIVDLQKRFRNFMRGKQDNPSAFYENDEFLVYANISYHSFGLEDYKFEIDILDKESNKVVSSFTHGIPNRNDYWHLDAAHIQLIGNELKLISINDFTDERMREARVYTFNIDEEKLTGDEQIKEIKSDDSFSSHGEISVLPNEADDSQIALFMTRTDMVKVDTGIEHYVEKLVKRKIVLYDLVEKAIEEIDLIEEHDKIGTPFYMNDSSIYFGTVLINKLDIKQYNIAEKKIENDMRVDINMVNVEHDNVTQSKVRDGKLYYVPTFGAEFTEEPSIVIVDLNNMESVYEGEVRLKGGKITENMFLYLDPPEFKY